MKTIKIERWDGKTVRMSARIFKVIGNRLKNHSLTIGDRVRLISGVEDNEEVGYHFRAGFVTVCPAYEKQAKFLGINKDDIVPINP